MIFYQHGMHNTHISTTGEAKLTSYLILNHCNSLPMLRSQDMVK